VTTKCYEFISRPDFRSFFNGETIFMRVYKHWLDHDVAALAFLIVGMTTVELLAMII